jgi:hypothetical protein
MPLAASNRKTPPKCRHACSSDFPARSSFVSAGPKPKSDFSTCSSSLMWANRTIRQMAIRRVFVDKRNGEFIRYHPDLPEIACKNST